MSLAVEGDGVHFQRLNEGTTKGRLPDCWSVQAQRKRDAERVAGQAYQGRLPNAVHLKRLSEVGSNIPGTVKVVFPCGSAGGMRRVGGCRG